MGKTILAIGDSITEAADDPVTGGWVGNLKTWFERVDNGNRVINAGIGGNTTRDLLMRMEKDCSPHNPDLILIAVGVNDSRIQLPETTVYFVPEIEFEENYRTILELAKKLADQVVSVGMIPVDQKRTTPIGEIHYYTVPAQERYTQIIKKTSSDQKIPHIDLFEKWREYGEDVIAGYLYDGLHPDPSGHKLMFAQIRDFLRTRALL